MPKVMQRGDGFRLTKFAHFHKKFDEALEVIRILGLESVSLSLRKFESRIRLVAPSVAGRAAENRSASPGVCPLIFRTVHLTRFARKGKV